MNHNQQENRGPGENRKAARERHDREAERAGNQRHDSGSDPAKFDEDLPYEQQPTWQRQGEEGRYRDTYNAARDEREDASVPGTARGGGQRDRENDTTRTRDGRHAQQANPGNVEPGQGDDRHEPNPGNRRANGEREQVDLPEPGDRERRSRNVDRGTH